MTDSAPGVSTALSSGWNRLPGNMTVHPCQRIGGAERQPARQHFIEGDG
jgi:hypothetical protein